MKKIIGFFIFFTAALIIFSFREPQKNKINWITVSALNELYYKDPRPVLVDVYTSWCGWCKEMDRTTYRNAKLTSYINEHYYAVKLDAESGEDVIFNKKNYRSSDLAAFLLSNQMSFPTTVFLPTIDAQPAPLPDYMKTKQMEAPLKYFAEGAYKKQSFVEFNKAMKNEW